MVDYVLILYYTILYKHVNENPRVLPFYRVPSPSFPFFLVATADWVLANPPHVFFLILQKVKTNNNLLSAGIYLILQKVKANNNLPSAGMRGPDREAAGTLLLPGHRQGVLTTALEQKMWPCLNARHS